MKQHGVCRWVEIPSWGHLPGSQAEWGVPWWHLMLRAAAEGGALTALTPAVTCFGCKRHLPTPLTTHGPALVT